MVVTNMKCDWAIGDLPTVFSIKIASKLGEWKGKENPLRKNKKVRKQTEEENPKRLGEKRDIFEMTATGKREEYFWSIHQTEIWHPVQTELESKTFIKYKYCFIKPLTAIYLSHRKWHHYFLKLNLCVLRQPSLEILRPRSLPCPQIAGDVLFAISRVGCWIQIVGARCCGILLLPTQLSLPEILSIFCIFKLWSLVFL